MLHSTPNPEVPRLADFNSFCWHCALREENFELLTLSKIEGALPVLPQQYTPPTYALEFVVRGSTRGVVNNRLIKLRPNDAFFIMAGDVHKEVEISSDCEIYIMGFTSQYAEKLNFNIPQAQFAHLIMHPRLHLTDEQMHTVLQYIDLLRGLIEANRTTAVLHLVRSLLHCLAADTEVLLQQTSTLTRAEQICGQFLSMVEIHCHEQHTVEWYAGQMCLSPKYLSNVLKQTLGTSPNRSIDQALIRRAKSLLSSTSHSVQEISELLGFQNQSHFGSFFRRHTGLNPSSFRNTVQ